MIFVKHAGAAIAFFAAALIGGQTLAFDKEAKLTDKSLADFSSVYIAPVTLNLDLDVKLSGRSGSGDRPISEKDQAQNADALHDDFVEAFSRSFTIAEASGENVLTVEATLTDLASSRPTSADFSRNPSLSFSSVYAGGAAVEIILSENDTVLAEISDRNFDSLNDGRARLGIWSDANYVFSRWSRKLVKFVQKN